MAIFGAIAALINTARIWLGLTCTCLALLQTQPKDSRVRESGDITAPLPHGPLPPGGPAIVIGDAGTHLVGVTELGHLVSMVKRLEEEGRGCHSS